MKKKYLYLLIIVLSILLLFSAFLVFQSKQKNNETELNTVNVSNIEKINSNSNIKILKAIDGGEKTQEMANNLKYSLYDLSYAYKDAVIYTYLFFHNDFSKNDPEKFDEIYENTVDAWNEVEILSETFKDDVLARKKNIWEKTASYFLKVANAKEIEINNDLNSFNPSAVNDFDDAELKVDFNSWDKVSVLSDGLPQLSLLDIVANEFNTTAKNANDLVQKHYHQASLDYNNASANYNLARQGAQILESSSKVALFVGGNILSAGSLSATVGLGQALVTTISGMDLALEVSDDFVSLVYPNKKGKSVYAHARKYIEPVSNIIGIADLKSVTDIKNSKLAILEVKDGAEAFYETVKGIDFSSFANKKEVKFLKDRTNNYNYLNQDQILEDYNISNYYTISDLNMMNNSNDIQDQSKQSNDSYPKGNYKTNFTVSFNTDLYSAKFSPEMQINLDENKFVKMSDSGTLALNQYINLEYDFNTLDDSQVEIEDNHFFAKGSYLITGRIFVNDSDFELPANYPSKINEEGFYEINADFSNDKLEGSIDFYPDSSDEIFSSEFSLSLQ